MGGTASEMLLHLACLTSAELLAAWGVAGFSAEELRGDPKGVLLMSIAKHCIFPSELCTDI